jgi:hypothetical protein
MVAMTQPETPPTSNVGKGDKYALVMMLLNRRLQISVEGWIREGRARGDSYNRLSDELNHMFREEYGEGPHTPRLTFESIRRWDPDGEFLKAARNRAAATDPAPAPPVQFQAPTEGIQP